MKKTSPSPLLLVLLLLGTSPTGNSSNSNSLRRHRNENDEVIITGNEKFTPANRDTKNRLAEINFAENDRNDRKIMGLRNKSAAKRITFDEANFQIGELVPISETGVVTQATTIGPQIRDVRSEVASPSSEARKLVKLNVKQGLIMNQLLSTYGLRNVSSRACKSHVEEFKLGLRAMESWALKMVDASSKLMPGILMGNIAELGAFEECLNIYHETSSGESIKGRHCMLHIRPTDELVKRIVDYRKEISWEHFNNLKANVLDDVKLTWSVCVPHSCTHEDVLRHFEKTFADVADGLNLTLSLSEKHCLTLDDAPSLTSGDCIYIFCVATILASVVVCSAVDTATKDNRHCIVELFSIRRNAQLLFSTKENKDDIACLHGIRFWSTYMIIYGHRFLHDLNSPIVNYLDLLDWLETYFSTTVHGGTITVDTFFLVSATLMSYMFMAALARGIKVNLFLLYLNRHLRLLCPLTLAVATYGTVLKHFGGGPLYNDVVESLGEPCRKYWWSSLLHLQPFVNPASVCIIQTWYLSVDMFWFYAAPFFVFALTRNKVAGYGVVTLALIGTTAFNFYVAWVKRYSGQMPVTPNLLVTDYLTNHYVQPLIRGSPYILGVVFGWALFNAKDRKIKMSRFTTVLGWLIVSFCLPSVVLVSQWFRVEGFHYNRLFSSAYLALHRPIWTCCLMWIIWCCQHGYGGFINTLLTGSLYRIVGRLSYNMFLFHYMFQQSTQHSKKTSTYFSNFISIFNSWADMVTLMLLSLPLTLCVEYPFNRFCTRLLKPKAAVGKIEPRAQETVVHIITRPIIET